MLVVFLGGRVIGLYYVEIIFLEIYLSIDIYQKMCDFQLHIKKDSIQSIPPIAFNMHNAYAYRNMPRKTDGIGHWLL